MRGPVIIRRGRREGMLGSETCVTDQDGNKRGGDGDGNWVDRNDN
jgi:hypothetical protein